MNGRLSFRGLIGFVVLMTCLPAEGAGGKRGTTIVFVCEHGSVKSLIAMHWFNRRAGERGLVHRAVSRGMAPDESVPKGIVEKLHDDGFTVENFTPVRLSTADLSGAERVISIGIDVTSVTKRSGVKVDEWNKIPPASENYATSRDAIVKRIDTLLTELERRKKP
jgi:arsenate reductase (thioredoxin)